MFSFMKKSGATSADGEAPTKERRKREKRDKHDRKSSRRDQSDEEPLRLDEVRRSLKLRGRRKEKEKLPSGITADYTASFFAQLDRDTGDYTNLDDNNHISPSHAPTIVLQSDSSETSLNSLHNPKISPRPPDSARGPGPPVPPRPPKRGILKSPRLSNASSNSAETNPSVDVADFVNGQDLVKNTLQNELISYNHLSGSKSASSGDDFLHLQNFTKKVIHSPIDGPYKGTYQNNFSPPPVVVTSHEKLDCDGQKGSNGTLPGLPSSSPSAGSLTDTTNSSFATPPFSMSPIGESQGFNRWSRSSNNDELPLPEIPVLELPKPRVLTIQRQKSPRNGFGFSLRRALIAERSVVGVHQNGHAENGIDREVGDVQKQVSWKAVVFAEPGGTTVTLQQNNETGLLPGDRLLEVNGASVDDKTREEIIELIKNSQDTVTVKVQPVSSLSELSRRLCADGGGEVTLGADNVRAGTLRRSASCRLRNHQAKTEAHTGWEAEWLSGGRLWLAHRGGFTAVRRAPVDDEVLPAGRVRVLVPATGEQIVVDEDDLEEANPTQLDHSEDISSLRCVNECGALHVLRARYAAGLVHARAGDALIVLNPRDQHLPIYSDKIASMFKGCRAEDTPPHVYAAAQHAHRSMLSSRHDRAIVFLGRSGSGKTTSLWHCARYLSMVARSSAAPKLTPERFDAARDLLDAFGNCRSVSNSSSTRHVSLISLEFDALGGLVAGGVQTLLLERSVVVPKTRTAHDTTFHAVDWLVYGCDARLRRELMLEQTSTSTFDGHVTPLEGWSRMTTAMTALEVSEREAACVWRVLAAVWHLAKAGVTKSPPGCALRHQFARAHSAEAAARLLGASGEELARLAFAGSERDAGGSGNDALDGLLMGLYAEVFNLIVAFINRGLSSAAARTASASITLVEAGGSDNPLSAAAQGGAGLPRLAANYVQERLQAVCREMAVDNVRDRYRRENVELPHHEEDWLTDNASANAMVDLLDKAPQNSIVRTSQGDLRDCDRRGLLWLLDEESMYPGSSDDSFLERVLSHHASSSSSNTHLIKKAPHARQFILQHMQGTNPVLYDVTGWVKASRENAVIKKALPLLQESTNEETSRLFVWSRGSGGGGPGGAGAGGMGGAGSDATLRRASSIRRTLTSAGAAGMKRRSAALQVKFAADALVDAIRRCGDGVRFVCCLLPDHAHSHRPSDQEPSLHVNVPLLRSQFRGFQLLDIARLYKQGFPEYMPRMEFTRRYRLLATSASADEVTTAAPAVLDAEAPPLPSSLPAQLEDMLQSLELDASCYRVGLTQIFFRGGVIGSLDARRDAALHERLTCLQARARGVLARRRAARLRVQHTAARCVQRNVRAFLAVRDWPWWRLLVRVMPLLAVHRTEERLRLAQDELETLRAKVEKIELERNHLKHDNEKLESKISAACGELAEERAAAASCAERADAETAERLRLERDLRDEQTRNEKLQQASERLELEVLHARAADAAEEESLGGGGAGDDDAGYRRRYERAARELQLARAQLRRQHEDDLEQLVAVKKQLDKKVGDAYEEVDEQRQVAAQWKRKVQKLTNDMADLRSLLDQQTCRNNLLEKRQRKFDAEAASALEEVRRERAAKERAGRERDQALADKYATDQALNEVRLELELKDERLSGLEREADVLRGGGGGGGEGELAQLRRARADLERKCRDQDEELDDLAGQIQMLESSKLRVEMLLEQQRKEARLEAQQRDDELEEARANALKKVKALESVLETEHGERTLLLRERHELERRLGALEEHARAQQHEAAQLVQRLKRDLKRHRALLRDAQTMLEQREKDSGSKAQIRQLKNQVEEAEVSVRAASKARAAAEAEAGEATAALEEAQRARGDATERANVAVRDLAALRAQLDDAEEEAAELMKKYRTCATSLSGAQAGAREAEARAEAAAEEARLLKERLAEATSRLSAAEAGHEQDAQHHNKRMELRIKELESSLEMEQTARGRLEGQVARLRDAQDKAGTELMAAKQREQNAQDELRRLQRQMRDLREEQTALVSRCEEAVRLRGAAEAAAAAASAEAAAAREEARVAARRARALQEAIAGDLSSPADSRDSDSENDSYSSDESIETFLANHKLSPSAPSRPAMQLDTQRSTDSRQSVSRSSVSSSKPHTPTKTSPTKETFA